MQAHAGGDATVARRTPAILTVPAVATAWCSALLVWLFYRLRVIDFLTASRCVALSPGSFGIRVRRFWYRWTLAACGEDLTVDWLATFKTPQARVGARVFIGSMSWIAEADIRDDVMIAARSAIQGGPDTHGSTRIDVPMSQQPGRLVTVVIGPDVWIGTGATVLADVSPGTIVAAGAVVTRSFPEYAILGGVPARMLRRRGETTDLADIDA